MSDLQDCALVQAAVAAVAASILILRRPNTYNLQLVLINLVLHSTAVTPQLLLHLSYSVSLTSLYIIHTAGLIIFSENCSLFLLHQRPFDYMLTRHP